MLLNLTKQLRKRIEDYKKTDRFSNYPLNRHNIRSIEIMINLTELAVESNFKLERHHFHWFKGGYLLAVDFNGEWKDISDLYSTIVDMMVNKGLVII